MYQNKRFKITFGNGTMYVVIRFVDVEPFECEQDALDKLIDSFERNGDEGYFITQKEIDENEIAEDQYIIGGNHGRYLYHHDLLLIEDIKERLCGYTNEPCPHQKCERCQDMHLTCHSCWEIYHENDMAVQELDGNRCKTCYAYRIDSNHISLN